MAVALILVDALSASYPVEAEMASVRDMAQDGIACPMENMYAYRGIEATLFSGQSMAEHGIWGEFRPATAPHHGGLPGRLGQALIRVGDLLPSDRLSLDVRWVAAKLQRQKHLPTGNMIPSALMPLFDSSMEAAIWSPGSLGTTGGGATLFDEMRQAGMNFETVVYPTIRLDSQVAGWVRQRISEGNLPDFWYIKFSALDALGHKHGPRLDRLATALRDLDAQLGEVVRVLRDAYGPSLDIVLLSDHGMSAVTQTVDIRPMLASTGLKPGRDFLYFLDSTTIRVWSENRSKLERLTHLFADAPGMTVLGPRERETLQVPNDKSAGDILVALDEGWVVFPDFFRTRGAPLGMHGYAEVYSLAGLPYLAAGGRISDLLPSKNRVTHADVWGAMRTRLGLATPPHSTVSEQVAAKEVVCTL